MRHFFKHLFFVIMLCLLGASTACSSNDNIIDNDNISVVSIPNPLELTSGQIVTLTGRGIKVGDELTFSGPTKFTANITVTSETTFTFQVPEGFTTGVYTLTLSHNGKNIHLGQTLIRINVNFDIPDREGMTVKGVVYCEGKGIKGVEVSDGIEVTTTDNHGIYYLPSKKKYGYVFISLPSGYEIECDGNAPLFFQRVSSSAPNLVEQKDFALTKVDNNKHAVLAMADFHLANRNKDIAQFEAMAKDINATAQSLQQQGYKVYGISLGDESWDNYWYSNHYGIAQAYEEMKKIDVPLFHCMGNHDNDPYFADDFLAEQAWIKSVVPVYYSMNIGNVHYIVMDNIQYLNTGGAEGVIGKRNYNERIISEEMEWLRKDLSLIKDKSTPIVIAMHAPLYDNPTFTNGQQTDKYNLQNATEFANALNEFSNVEILTGHKHLNYNIDNGNIKEHNTGAICATWWWTGKLSGNHICCDGTPGGYGVYTWNNKDVQWYYKSYGYDKSYQFRAYDINKVFIDPATFAPEHQEDMREYAHGYATPKNDNEILLNVWNYDPTWKVEVTENGKPLTVQRIDGYDPLHIISYDAPRIKSGGKSAVTFPTELTVHLFKAKASSAQSDIKIIVTDRFGNKYTEVMKRPKDFSINMK